MVASSSAIMEEKVKSTLIPTGVITMGGTLVTTTEGHEDVLLSEPKEDFKNGKIKLILGHAESWISETGKEILDSLRSSESIVMTFVDEYHQGLSAHWEGFRQQMKLVPGQLRCRAVRGSPTLGMTATSTKAEITEIKRSLGLRDENTVVLEANPVQKNLKIVKIQRPANIYGTFGMEKNDVIHPGLIDSLKDIVLDEYVHCVTNGIPFKKTILFGRKLEDLLDIHDYLCNKCPELAANPNTCPFVLYHASTGPITTKSFQERQDQISLYLTSVMLMGLGQWNLKYFYGWVTFTVLKSSCLAAYPSFFILSSLSNLFVSALFM